MCGEQAECDAQQAQQSTSQVLLWGLIIAFAVFCVIVPMAQKTARKRGMTLIQLVGTQQGGSRNKRKVHLVHGKVQ